MPRIYTRTGDQGLTSLYGGQRVPKFKTRVEVFGSLDELNAVIGVALSELTDEQIRPILTNVQNSLFNIGAEAAEGGTKAKRMIEDELRVGPEHAAQLEAWIDEFNDEAPALTGFILPGGSRPGALLHQARTVCRRAERKLARLGEEEEINPASLVYVNRLSDLLFVLARTVNHRAGIIETPWQQDISQ